jgi:hypothetical protein
MTASLKRVCVPVIRELGFTGSFPHFRRRRGEHLEMLMFGFNKYGGSFYLEAGRITEARCRLLQQHWRERGKELPESELSVGHCEWNQRGRLGGEHFGCNEDHWFVFGPERFGDTRADLPEGGYDALSASVATVLRSQVEAFFAAI